MIHPCRRVLQWAFAVGAVACVDPALVSPDASRDDLGASLIPDGDLDAGEDSTEADAAGARDAVPIDAPGLDVALDAGDDADTPWRVACGLARTLAGPTSLRGERVPSGPPSPVPCLTGPTGPERYYAVTLAPRQLVAVTVSPVGVWNPSVRLLGSCSATTCLASVDNGADELDEVLGYRNPTSADITVIIAVGSRGSAPGGSFDLDVALRDAPGNAVCAGALPVSDGGALAGQDLRAAYETSAACLPTAPGAELYYTAAVPAGRVLLAVVEPSGVLWNPVVRLLERCGAASCLGVVNDGLTGEGEALAYFNPGLTEVTAVIAVGSNLARISGDFALRVLSRPPLAHGACDDALVVSPDATLAGEWLLLARSASVPCGGGEPVRQLFYRVAVPGGNELRVTATPRAPVPWLPVLRLQESCGGGACLARSPTRPGGDAQTLTWTNTDATPRTLILSVANLTAAVAAFDIALSTTAR